MNVPDLEQALKLFDETTGALSARIQRLEAVLVQKTRELAAKVGELDSMQVYLTQVMTSLSSGVIAVDTNGRITTANAAAVAALNGVFTPEPGLDYRHEFPDSPLWRLLDGSDAVGDYEHTVKVADGTRRILALKAAPLRSSDGTLLGAVEIFDDVTEVRRLRELVDRSDRLQQLGEMAAGVAHEIRNPLNGIEGFASLLARDLPAVDSKARYASLIVEGVRHLNRTVTGLLEYAKPRRLERATHDPAALVQSVIELIAADSDVTLEHITFADNRQHPGPIECDGHQIRQVVMNLIRNAIQAVTVADSAENADDSKDAVSPDTTASAPAAPQVHVSLSDAEDSDESSFIITVDDNGPGISRDERQRIFTPFYTTKDDGTGLGLAVSHTIINLHGGHLLVDDSPLGGARFRIVLPT